jgi:hypothetical protein
LGGLLIAAMGGSAIAGQETLRWKLEPGQTLRYEFSQDNVIEVELPNQAIETKNTLTFGLNWEVKSVEADGSARIEQTVDYVRVTIVAPGQDEVVYDTREEGEPPAQLGFLKTLYGAVLGKPYGLTLDARGVIRDVQVPEEVSAAAKGSPAEAMADGGSLISAKGVERLLAQVIPPLPEGPAEAGATWDLKLVLPAGPLVMTLVNRYRLESSDGGQAVVKADIDTGIAPGEGAPFEVEVGDQKGDGTYRFDVAKGRLVDTRVVQDIAMKLKAMGQEVPQHFVITATLKARDEGK